MVRLLYDMGICNGFIIDSEPIVVWDDSRYSHNIEEFSYDELRLLNLFVSVHGLTYARLKRSLLLKSCGEGYMTLIGGHMGGAYGGHSAICVDEVDSSCYASVFDESILLRYGFRAIVTDVGRLLYTEPFDLGGTVLTLGSICKYVYDYSMENLYGGYKIKLDDRVISISHNAFGRADIPDIDYSFVRNSLLLYDLGKLNIHA